MAFPASRFLLFVATLLLTACASPRLLVDGLPARGDIRVFALDARFSLTHAAERHAGRLVWQHLQDGDRFQFFSPLGQTVAELDFDPRHAQLRMADGAVHEAPGPDALVLELLGYPLPIDRLAAWTLARPQGDAQVERDPSGRPVLLAESGWQIRYEYEGTSPDALPVRLFVSRDGGPELRLRIEAWYAP